MIRRPEKLDRVIARHIGCFDDDHGWQPGTVIEVTGCTSLVMFADGDQVWISHEKLLPLNAVDWLAELVTE